MKPKSFRIAAPNKWGSEAHNPDTFIVLVAITFTGPNGEDITYCYTDAQLWIGLNNLYIVK